MPTFECEDLMLLSFFYNCKLSMFGFCSFPPPQKKKDLIKTVTYVENMYKMRKKKLHYRNKH